MRFQDKLLRLNACSDAVAWAKGFTSAQEAWDSCERGDWMLWILGRTINCDKWTDGRKPFLSCAMDCAETVKHLWPKSQRKRIGAAMHTLRKWIDGTATTEQATAARHELYAAANAAHAAAAADADAAYAAAYATCAAAEDATYAAYAAARSRNLAKCADIIRKHFTKPPTWRPYS